MSVTRYVTILIVPRDRILTTGYARGCNEVLLAPNIASCPGFIIRADPSAVVRPPEATFAHSSTSKLGFCSRATHVEEIGFYGIMILKIQIGILKVMKKFIYLIQ